MPRSTTAPMINGFPNQMIQRNSASDDIASRQSGRQLDIVLARQRCNGFTLDQCNFTSRAGMGRISAGPVEVSVAFESSSRNSSDG